MDRIIYISSIKKRVSPIVLVGNGTDVSDMESLKRRAKSKLNKGMYRAFSLILNRYKKRYQRGKAIQLIGIKSLECNFNPQRKTYNPHFHIITANHKIADHDSFTITCYSDAIDGAKAYPL
ncbi:hypothetical protein ETU08_09155, partial [Apibacter muscae]|uniref:hypothetical protein n=1 Tax=Apibacter muscae TaxID=2509004 RepID=UPI0011AC3DE8